MEPDAPQTFTAPIFNNPQHRERFQYLLETSEMQRVAIEELFQFSRHAYDVMHDLNTRVIQLEGGVDTSVNQNDRDITSRVTELDREFMSIGTQVTNFGHTVTNSNTLAALDSTPGEESAPRDLSNVMVNVQRFSSSAQASTHLVTRKASRHLMTDDVQAGRIAKTGVAKQSKKLKLEIPDNVNGLGVASPSNSASQTSPLSAFVPSAPASPITPYPNGRIGPPDAYRRTNTAINKRGIHNCDKSVPPADVQMPKIPLTDVEVIVFFFNSLSKPMVSLRLYGRNWGPATIVQVLNDHRLIEPPYLRNTCSVKCTTALKNGRKKFGPDWEQDYRQVFTTADDAKATDLIRTEEENSVDYYVRALGTNLQSFPADESAGIFTRCVKYCIENNAPYTMSNVHLLALDLQNGMIPQHPASPAPGDVVTPTHLKSESSNGEEAEYYFGQDDVSPSADRTSYLRGVGALGGFKNLDAPQK